MDPPTRILAAGRHHQCPRLRDPRRRPRSIACVECAATRLRRTATRIEFSQARVEFTRTPGRMAIRDGVVRGPMIGATIEGNIDYARDEVRMRGTLVPLYGLNNMFGQIPIVGLFLGGGSNEGMFGITYEVAGPTEQSAAAWSIRSRRSRRACCASSSSSAIVSQRARVRRPRASDRRSGHDAD